MLICARIWSSSAITNPTLYPNWQGHIPKQIFHLTSFGKTQFCTKHQSSIRDLEPKILWSSDGKRNYEGQCHTSKRRAKKMKHTAFMLNSIYRQVVLVLWWQFAKKKEREMIPRLWFVFYAVWVEFTLSCEVMIVIDEFHFMSEDHFDLPFWRKL